MPFVWQIGCLLLIFGASGYEYSGQTYIPVGPTSNLLPVSHSQAAQQFADNSTLNQLSSADEVEEVWVLSGTRAALPCNTAPSHPHEQLAAVLWYVANQGEPIYTFDSRGGNGTSWSEEGPRGFGDRATFLSSVKPSLLFVDSIRTDDSGQYRCRVDFRTSQTRNTIIHLHVIVPSLSPMIVDEVGRPVVDVLGPYEEGSTVKVTCLSSGGVPLPRLEWFESQEDSESTIKDTTFELTPDGLATQNVLVIKRLSRDYFGKTLSCIASNNNVTLPMATNVSLDMKLLPRNVTISKPKEPFSVFRPATLECKSVGSRPPAILTWWKRGKFMGKPFEEFVLNEHGESTSVSRMAFQPKGYDDEKDVTCRAENIEIAKSAIDDTLRLVVHYPPKAQLSLGTNIHTNNIAEGNDMYMDCSIKANPRSYKVDWTHNGQRLESSPSSGLRIMAGGKSLVLQKIHKRHSGNYTCTAYNLEGEDTSNVLEINVMYKPECVHTKPISLSIVPQKDVEVSCHVRAHPPPTDYKWTVNSSSPLASELKPSHYTINGTVSKLIYKAVGDQAFGTITCWAYNQLGEANVPCKFNFVPAGPPELPRDCDVHNHTINGLSVTCGGGDSDNQMTGFSHGLPQKFHIEVRDRDTGQLLQNQTSDQPTFSISGFRNNRGVNLKIFSSNAFGRSVGYVQLETTPSKVAELQIETSSKKDVNTDLMIGILVGLLSTMLLLAALIYLFVKFQHVSQPNNSDAYRSQQQSGGQLDSSAMELKSGPTGSSELARDNPDLIALQVSSIKRGVQASNPSSHHSNSETETSYLFQTGLEDRPPPPSLQTSHPFCKQDVNMIQSHNRGRETNWSLGADERAQGTYQTYSSSLLQNAKAILPLASVVNLNSQSPTWQKKPQQQMPCSSITSI